MAFLIFQYADGELTSVTPFDSKPVGFEDEVQERRKLIGLEYDFNPENEFISALVLSEDGTTVTNKYPGKTAAEQQDLFNTEKRNVVFQQGIRDARERIKGQVNVAARMLDLIKPRAIELDGISGTKEKQTILAQWRSEARAWNNTREQLLDDTVTTAEELEEFNADWLSDFLVQHPVPVIE